ncbi:MAG TPA: lysozyme inhibitor LprI family protein [Caulobacteraceae bacterium]|nr:lysozyme inhibitor LprI family protein [Caulobacteraceae bacterium]
MRAAWLAGLALAAALPTLAAEAPKDPAEARYTPAYQKCLDSPDGQSTAGMIGCTDAELKLQDAALNAAYRKAMKDLTPGQKAKLQAAQRAWIAFRDAECASYEDEDWGSLSRINAASCVLHMTVLRTIDLEAYPPAT